jgi:molybdopterin synthase sulfur carrier subunit
MIRIALPHHLQVLATCNEEVELEIAGEVTQRSVLDALEARFPMLRGTVRDHVSLQRRPMVRFFADGEDVTHLSPDAALPETVASGREPFRIVGAVAGG